MMPVKFIDPEIFIEPVNVIVSTLAENTVEPAAPEINVEPVTINEPEIIADPVYGNVGAAIALSAYDAVVEKDADVAKLDDNENELVTDLDADTAKLELSTVIELVCDDTI
jgi:hypothetical protein